MQARERSIISVTTIRSTIFREVNMFWEVVPQRFEGVQLGLYVKMLKGDFDLKLCIMMMD